MGWQDIFGKGLTKRSLCKLRLIYPICFLLFLLQSIHPPRLHCTRSSSSPLLSQVGSEMAVSGQAVGIFFEEKLQQIFPGQDFPEVAEDEESPNTKEKEEDTDDSDDDFIQPRRKRLKTDDKVMHIK